MSEINLKVAVKEMDGAVVMASIEFPGIIVQGSDLDEARKEIIRSMDDMFQVQATTYGNQRYYPLIDADRVETLTLRAADGGDGEERA